MSNLIDKQVAAIKRPLSVLDESVWRRFERDQARRERYRYVNNARHRLGGPSIRPAAFMQPQMMIKVDGVWKPYIGEY